LWSHAPRRIGESSPREYLARFLFTDRIATRSAHVIDQDCEVASAIAAETLSAMRPLLPVDEDAETRHRSIIERSGERFVIMNPGAGWGAKRWPVERYGQVAAMLHELGYAVLTNSSPDEKDLADELIKASGNIAISMEGDLNTLIAITRRASLAIAGDTGPLHLACALGVPVVGIFGPTDPARNGPYGFNHSRYRVLRSPQSRRDHSRRAEPEAGLLTITPEAVFDAAVELLNETPNQRESTQL
jgi:heptosyltransferase-1